jgi:hypothetical protein
VTPGHVTPGHVTPGDVTGEDSMSNSSLDLLDVTSDDEDDVMHVDGYHVLPSGGDGVGEIVGTGVGLFV